MQRICLSALLASALTVPACADPLNITPEAYAAAPRYNPAAASRANVVAPRPEPSPAAMPGQPRYAEAQPNYGGGFIELLFGGAGRAPAIPRAYQPDPGEYQPGQPMRPSLFRNDPAYAPAESEHQPVDPKYSRQLVAYQGGQAPGTIVIDTPNRFLYLVQEGGRALRYGIGVGRPGFTWAGEKTITAKREWPEWRPPDEMLRRRPDLPRYMAGGPDNPLGARAMYLGSTLYRIHGSNEPWTIGTQVSSGCIRMRNEDVEDLYGRVKVGTKVVVI